MATLPTAPPANQVLRVGGAFARLADRLRELNIDTVITIGDDHYRMFGPRCIPQCLIGIGDVDGPLENDLGFSREVMPNNEALAQHLLTSGLADGIAWSFSKTLVVDHSTAIPYQLCYKGVSGLRIIPIYLNDGVPPFIPNRLAGAIGESLARAIASWPEPERIAICGTGGCSHWVGSPEGGRVNESFDRELIELVRNGDLNSLMALEDADVLAEAGNGAIEYKNWICAMVCGKVCARRDHRLRTRA